MANIQSAEKQRRQAEKAKARNRAAKSRLRSQIKNTRAAIEEGGKDLGATLNATFSTIDKAAKKGLIKTNTASRYKSRINASAKRSAAK